MLSFVDESYTLFYKHVETYLNACLKQNNIKLFTALLHYFTKIDKVTVVNLPDKCELRKYDGFWVCQCVFLDGCAVSFNDICGREVNHNIFTHRAEELYFFRDEMFCWQRMGEVYVFFDREYCGLRDVTDEIDGNYKFYRLIDGCCRVVDDGFKCVYDGNEYLVTKELDFYYVRGEKVEKDNVISFLLKRGVDVRKALNYRTE